MDANLVSRLEACEQRQRRLALTSYILAAALAISLGSRWGITAAADASPVQQLRAHELVIVDSKGVERVRVGGDLPDAIINGKKIPRGEQAAGVLIYDGTGQERGGYVTWEPSGNAGLTLDTRKNQVVLLVAGPQDSSAFALRHEADLIEMRSDPDGTRLTSVRGGKLISQDPPISSLKAETCSDYRDVRSRKSMERAISACQARFTDDACHACLDPK